VTVPPRLLYLINVRIPLNGHPTLIFNVTGTRISRGAAPAVMMGTVNFLKIFAVLIFGAAQITAGRSVTGTVRLVEGGPAAGVRVVAMVVPAAGRGGRGSSVLASLTQADKDGRYQLENVPPGRYYIAAGALDSPTFYPGTLMQSEAQVVTITQDGSALSGIDFSLSRAAAAAPPLPPIAANLPCCDLYGVLLTEDGSPLPDLPLRVVDTGRTWSVAVYDGFFHVYLQRGATVQLAITGLPPGYALKSVVYGGRNAGPALQIDGRRPESLLLTLSVQPGLARPKVTARGKVVNIAAELKAASLSLVLTPTNASDTTLVAPVRPDYSFELSDVPIGSYRAGVRPAGTENLWPASANAVVRDAVSELTIDLANNPFPELGGGVAYSIFVEDKETTITGVVTQRFTPLRSGKSGYFRMNVRDERTGVVTTWAVYVADYALIPNISPGETYTVPGTTARDGTNRLRAKPF
jgi:hypothetical protein